MHVLTFDARREEAEEDKNPNFYDYKGYAHEYEHCSVLTIHRIYTELQHDFDSLA